MKFERKKREVWKRRDDAVTSSGEEDGSFRVELEKEKGEGEMCQPRFFSSGVIFPIVLLLLSSLFEIGIGFKQRRGGGGGVPYP